MVRGSERVREVGQCRNGVGGAERMVVSLGWHAKSSVMECEGRHS